MNQNLELIRVNGAEVTVENEFHTRKAEALESSALIFAIRNEDEHKRAVAAQTKLATLIRDVEKQREALAKPVVELHRLINAKAAAAVQELDDEGSRIAELVGEYQEKERIRLAAEMQLQDAALDRLEREMNEKLACADTIEQQDAIRAEYSEKRRLTATPLQSAPSAKGQVIKQDWDIEIQDIHALYQAAPQCVKITPVMSEIKNLLRMNVVPRGLTAKPKVIATVRSKKTEPKATDV